MLVILVILLLFGATKLPELARGSGRALRIFKAETKGLVDDDDEQPRATTTGRAARDRGPPTRRQPPTDRRPTP